MEECGMVNSQSGLPSGNAPAFGEGRQEKKKVPMVIDRKDKLFAWIYLAVGYGFIYTFSSVEFQRNFAIFIVAYTMVVMAYLFSKGKKPAAESYFWLAILWGMGIPFAWWSVMPFLQIPAVIFVAAYWTLTAAGGLIEHQRTSQWVICDSWNAVCIVPFYNFMCHIRAIAKGEEDETGQQAGAWNRILTIGLGLCIAIPILVIALPLLASADEAFGQLLMGGGAYIERYFGATLVRFLFSVPVTFYLFGLIYGGIQKRHTDRIIKEDVRDAGNAVKVVPDIAIQTAILVVCLVYLLFIGLQAKYLFSAFAGIRPEGFTYAEYARQGFFELCDIAVLNLVVLVGANCFSRTRRSENAWLRRGNVLLAVLTFLLIATVMSKMALYIYAYGLTEKRVITMVFMIWLLVVFLMMIIWQYRKLPIVRIAIMTGAVLFCLLCVVPVHDCIGAFNRCFQYI